MYKVFINDQEVYKSNYWLYVVDFLKDCRVVENDTVYIKGIKEVING